MSKSIKHNYSINLDNSGACCDDWHWTVFEYIPEQKIRVNVASGISKTCMQAAKVAHTKFHELVEREKTNV